MEILEFFLLFGFVTVLPVLAVAIGIAIYERRLYSRDDEWGSPP